MENELYITDKKRVENVERAVLMLLGKVGFGDASRILRSAVLKYIESGCKYIYGKPQLIELQTLCTQTELISILLRKLINEMDAKIERIEQKISKN